MSRLAIIGVITNGANTNNDGIIDSSYVINANNKDNYPLNSQFNIKSEIVELPTSIAMSTPTPSPPNFGPTSSPTIPEFSLLALLLLMIVILFVAIKFRHRKPTNLKQ